MYLIATDEAGYGPKLGPLVIVATAWRLPDASPTDASPTETEVASRFAPLSEPVRLPGLSGVVNDSKSVYRQGDGLSWLHAVASAGLSWCGFPAGNFDELLERVCAQDLPSIRHSPWLSGCDTAAMLDATKTMPLVDHWSSGGIALVGVTARVITAKEFNRQCQQGFNKADLLSHCTLGLIRDHLDSLPNQGTETQARCDRHGGRRYYAGPLLHHFPERQLRIIEEMQQQSRYRLDLGDDRLDIRFTVKGDRFPPVAFSSLIAKYLRERFMESLNRYFAERCQDPTMFRPTAGYPVDADRFLVQIETIRRREGIDDADLVRSR
jgi:hypothetical protein